MYAIPSLRMENAEQMNDLRAMKHKILWVHIPLGEVPNYGGNRVFKSQQ